MRPVTILLALLLSCDADTSQEGGKGGMTSTPVQEPSGLGEPGDQSGWSMCGVMEYEFENSSIELPMECELLWIDKGDPPPDAEIDTSEDRSNPWDVEAIIEDSQDI